MLSTFDDFDAVPVLGLDPRFAGLVRLAALGYPGKRFETRTIATSYRGPLVIAATSGKSTRDDPVLGLHFEAARAHLVHGGLVPAEVFEAAMHFEGHAVALVTVAGVRPLLATDWPRAFFSSMPDEPRFAWELTNLWPLAPCKVRVGQLFTRAPVADVAKALASEFAVQIVGLDATREDVLDALRLLCNFDLPGLGPERWSRVTL